MAEWDKAVFKLTSYGFCVQKPPREKKLSRVPTHSMFTAETIQLPY